MVIQAYSCMNYSRKSMELFTFISFLSLLSFARSLKYSSLFLSIIRYKQIMIEEQPNALPSFCLLVEPKTNRTPSQLSSQIVKLENHARQKGQKQPKLCTSVTLLKEPPTEIAPSGLVCKLPNGQKFNLKVQLSARNKKEISKPNKKSFKKPEKQIDDRLRAIAEGPHESLLDKFLSYFKYVQEEKRLQVRMWQTRIFTDERKLHCEEDMKRERGERWWRCNERMKVVSWQIDEAEEGLIFLK